MGGPRRRRRGGRPRLPRRRPPEDQLATSWSGCSSSAPWSFGLGIAGGVAGHPRVPRARGRGRARRRGRGRPPGPPPPPSRPRSLGEPASTPPNGRRHVRGLAAARRAFVAPPSPAGAGDAGPAAAVRRVRALATHRRTRSSPKGPIARSIDNLFDAGVPRRRRRVHPGRVRHAGDRRQVPRPQKDERRRRRPAGADPRQHQARDRLDDPPGRRSSRSSASSRCARCSSSTSPTTRRSPSRSPASSGGGSTTTTSTTTASSPTRSSPPTTWSSRPASTVNLDITSNDVIHSFWIPTLNGKKDAVPGTHPRAEAQADEPGIYLGQCTEFCGLSHANMRMQVIALPQDEYEDWLSNQELDAEMPDESVDGDEPTAAEGEGGDVEVAASDAQAGAELFATQCSGCHLVRGINDEAVRGRRTAARSSSCRAPRPTSRTSPPAARSPAPSSTSGVDRGRRRASSRTTRSAKSSNAPATSRPGCANPPAEKPMHAPTARARRRTGRGMPNLGLTEDADRPARRLPRDPRVGRRATWRSSNARHAALELDHRRARARAAPLGVFTRPPGRRPAGAAGSPRSTTSRSASCTAPPRCSSS